LQGRFRKARRVGKIKNSKKMKAKNYIILVVVFFAMVAGSCKKEDLTPGGVTANFTYYVSGKTVTFTNTSTGGVTYLWSFGDGDTDYSASTTHTYASSGSYNVTLTATGLLGSNDTETKVVVVP
jgi:PKD repeat protein